MKATAPPQLARPGAGIPPMELVAAKIIFAVLRAVKTREWANRHFHSEATRMMKIARSLTPQAANAPVLIPRVVGIEDSSRNWSVLMTLDHLVIVNSAIIEIIEHLSSERLYTRQVSIAAVKPKREQTLETIDRFGKVTKSYVDRVSRAKNLVSAARHRHPWFGPMDALGWHWLATVHQTIHRRQMESIITNADQLS